MSTRPLVLIAQALLINMNQSSGNVSWLDSANTHNRGRPTLSSLAFLPRYFTPAVKVRGSRRISIHFNERCCHVLLNNKNLEQEEGAFSHTK